MSEIITCEAIECVQNDKIFYSTLINSKILKEVCYISRRDENPEKGFQRLLNKTRAKDIAEYLDKNKGVIPSAVILSAQDKAKISYNKKNRTISFNLISEGFLIIDGQHRLYGLYEAKEYYDIPVMIFTNLNTTDEVNLFIDINTTQKGVPSALLLDIKALSAKETKIEEKQRELFDQLNNNSPLAGFLSSSHSVTGKISRKAFNDATINIFEDGPMSTESLDIVIKGVKNYLYAIEYVFKQSKSTEARLNKTVLFKAIFSIFNDVCSRCLQEKNDLKIDSLKSILEPISVLDYNSYIGTNKTTIKKIITDMKKQLVKSPVLKEDMF